jgi:hypothetical protein
MPQRKQTPKTPKQTSSASPADQQQQYSVRDRSERALHRTPVLDKIIVDQGESDAGGGLLRGMDVKALRIRRKKAREIQIPGWRQLTVERGRTGQAMVEEETGVMDIEDTSDEIYIERHAKERPSLSDLFLFFRWNTGTGM